MLNDVTVFNIREYLSAKGDKDLGEDELRHIFWLHVAAQLEDPSGP